MAKKPYRRRRRKFNLRKVRNSNAAVIGALAALDVVKATLTAPVTEAIRIVSLDLAYTWSGKAAIDDAAEFGVAHSDYTAQQIEECLEATGSIDLGDKSAQERSNRLVRSIGIITGPAVSGASGGARFNDGMRVKTRLNWLLSTGDTIDIWIRNGSGNVYTTGGTLVSSGNIWVKD